ncbi:hypothetical protein I3843_11G085700 [Carya illinoinensis]|uniref:Uncharacterized protein n=1 Tax=Carya illinoinensis TaxID=32201 RepID=A0A922DN93_CARIL|nr:hypothetical protein I3842_11G086400 [Carya illinoinensis]KAG7955696.1 hypothetical protein I3843_11G085700 [Carya illinoinensis]
MSVDAVVDPHEKMRARDVNKVARGEQAPTPAHEYGTVSRAPCHPGSNNRENQDNKDEYEEDTLSSDLNPLYNSKKYI